MRSWGVGGVGWWWGRGKGGWGNSGYGDVGDGDGAFSVSDEGLPTKEIEMDY